MVMLDTNAILRFLLQDDRIKADFVEKQMLEEKYLIPVEVFAEVVYVLDKVYKTERIAIHQKICVILSDKNSVIPCQPIVSEAIEVYSKTKFDFVDCLMVGYAKYEGHEIITFDKKLKKYLTTHEFETTDL